jgi:hypothetical protein
MNSVTRNALRTNVPPANTASTQATTQTEPSAPLLSVDERRRQALSGTSFLNAAKELTAERKEQARQIQSQIDQLPQGILTNRQDIAQFRELTKALAAVNPVLAGGQTYEDQVLKITRTDFAQTEVEGLRPSGDVFQVLADAKTRANISQFTTPDGRTVNAVEIGKVDARLTGAQLEITGLYGFGAVTPPLSTREQLTLTKAIAKALDVVGRIEKAAEEFPQVGPRPAAEVNAFVNALEDKDAAAFETFLAKTGISDEEKQDIRALEAGITDAERAVLKRVGEVFDLNTPLGPVAGTIAGRGVGFQQFLSKEGNEPGNKVVFQSGSSFSIEGLPVGNSVQEPGQRGYRYTFEAERLALD